MAQAPDSRSENVKMESSKDKKDGAPDADAQRAERQKRLDKLAEDPLFEDVTEEKLGESVVIAAARKPRETEENR
jgi:hypothetical protein